MNNTGLGLAKPAEPQRKKKKVYPYRPEESQFRQGMFRQHMTRDGYMGAYFNPQRRAQAPAERKWTGSKW